MPYTAKCTECNQRVCVPTDYSEATEARDDHLDETGHVTTVEQV